MEREELVAKLNEDLGTEYKSIVQYVQHIAVITGAEYQAMMEELRSHLAQELEHALTLAEQIAFLGGVPSVDVPSVESVTESRAALEMDLELEERQLDRYRARVREARELGLEDVALRLEPLLEQTQDHVEELRTALGK